MWQTHKETELKAEKKAAAELSKEEKQNEILGKILALTGEEGFKAAVGEEKAAAFLKAQEKEKAAVDKTAKPLTAAEKLIAEKEEKQAKVAALLGELHGDAIAGEKLAAATLET